jgi:hypothetical protein
VDSLSEILTKQAGFAIDPHGNVTLRDEWCTLEVQLLIQLVASWCLEKNRRYLFAHQATNEILKDFELNEPDPKLDQPRKL